MQPTHPPISPSGRIVRAVAAWLLRQLARLMRTGDPAATVDRLFTSRHVKDLRLIIAGALLSLGVSVALCLFYAAEQAKIAGPWDVLGAAKFLAAAVFYASPVVGVVGGIMAWVYRIGSARLGVVDLFACEISTLCRIALVVDTVHRNIELFDRGPAVGPASGGSLPTNAIRFTSQENYFPVFESNTRDLQSLEARVVINITEFYTYMKMVRDLMRSRTESPPGDSESATHYGKNLPAMVWHETARDLIYMLFLSLESARKSINDLVEFQPEHAERTIVIMISELEAYRFLLSAFIQKNDMRWRRLLLRWEHYEVQIPDLCSRVPKEMHNAAAKVKQAEVHKASTDPEILEALKNEHQEWKAANELLPDLRQRYECARTAATKRPAVAIPAP
jgi:hypothetical protein